MIKVSFYLRGSDRSPGDVDDVCRSLPEPLYLSFPAQENESGSRTSLAECDSFGDDMICQTLSVPNRLNTSRYLSHR